MSCSTGAPIISDLLDLCHNMVSYFGSFYSETIFMMDQSMKHRPASMVASGFHYFETVSYS